MGFGYTSARSPAGALSPRFLQAPISPIRAMAMLRPFPPCLQLGLGNMTGLGGTGQLLCHLHSQLGAPGTACDPSNRISAARQST